MCGAICQLEQYEPSGARDQFDECQLYGWGAAFSKAFGEHGADTEAYEGLLYTACEQLKAYADVEQGLAELAADAERSDLWVRAGAYLVTLAVRGTVLRAHCLDPPRCDLFSATELDAIARALRRVR